MTSLAELGEISKSYSYDYIEKGISPALIRAAEAGSKDPYIMSRYAAHKAGQEGSKYIARSTGLDQAQRAAHGQSKTATRRLGGKRGTLGSQMNAMGEANVNLRSANSAFNANRQAITDSVSAGRHARAASHAANTQGTSTFRQTMSPGPSKNFFQRNKRAIIGGGIATGAGAGGVGYAASRRNAA